MKQVLTEKDLELLFSSKGKVVKKQRARKIMWYIAGPILFMVILFIAVNYRSLGENFYYWLKFDYMLSAPLENPDASLPTVAKKTIESYPKPDNLPEIENNNLNIPVLNVTAPVSWKILNQSANISDALSKGVAQIAGTSLPGEQGNVFITGHSSNYPWAKGNYNSVFAILNKLVVGDIAQIKYNNQIYAYKVSEIKVVEPSNLEVMYPTTEPSLTIMTCTPVGTNLRRLIIISKQIYPDPANNTKQTTKFEEQSMPKVH